MPPGSEAFMAAFLNTILSQYGALVSALLVAIWYLTRQLADERKAHDVTTGKLLVLTEKYTEVGNSTVQTLAGLKTLVERIAYDKGDHR